MEQMCEDSATASRVALNPSTIHTTVANKSRVSIHTLISHVESLTIAPSEAEITNVGETGLSPEEEYLNRERKYSVGGHDVRKFSRGTKNSLAPSTDPYYSRKKVTGKFCLPEAFDETD